jgi:uncharacterized protein (TIGR02679 family)
VPDSSAPAGVDKPDASPPADVDELEATPPIGAGKSDPHQVTVVRLVVDRAARVLARPGLAPLVDELVRRFGAGPIPVRLTVPTLDPAARTALADLLGSARAPKPGERLAVSRVAAAVGLTDSADLRAAVELLRGPLGDRRADRQWAATQREELWRWLADQASVLDLGTGRGRLDGWVDNVRAAGVRGGIDAHRGRLRDALRVLAALPADGPSLASFAADVLGDPHALDHGRATAGLALDAISRSLGQDRSTDAESARQLWETVGVVPDPLSSTVLTLGLPGGDSDPLQQWLSAASRAGEPVVLTLANLRRWPPRPLPKGSAVFVVENPSIVTEAAIAGWGGSVLVCSSGRPTVAAVTLLRGLLRDGAIGWQHADFDPSGLAITEWLRRRAGTVPWRMSAADYLGAVPRSARPVVGSIPPTPWDAGLAEAMARCGRIVYEEQIRADLLAAVYETERAWAARPDG